MEMKKYTVYKHTFPNGKVYIGITSQTPQKRWKNGYGYLEKRGNKYSQPFVARAILKYGWDNILHEILFEELTQEEAINKEKELIEQYNANNPQYGYNNTKGGEGSFGKTLSEETKEKISKTLGKPVICMETGIVYFSTKDAQDKTNINKSHIGSCARGNRKTAGGYHWQYIEEVA